MSNVSALIQQAMGLALSTFKTRDHLFLLVNEQSTDRLPFEAMILPIEITITDDDGNASAVSGMGFEIDGETFRGLNVSCHKDMAKAVIVRFFDNKRQTWKLNEEQPYDEIIIGGLGYRLNAILIKEEPTV